MTKLLEDQSDHGLYKEILQKLVFNQKIECGLCDSDNNRTISNEKMGRRIRAWSK